MILYPTYKSVVGLCYSCWKVNNELSDLPKTIKRRKLFYRTEKIKYSSFRIGMVPKFLYIALHLQKIYKVYKRPRPFRTHNRYSYSYIEICVLKILSTIQQLTAYVTSCHPLKVQNSLPHFKCPDIVSVFIHR